MEGRRENGYGTSGESLGFAGPGRSPNNIGMPGKYLLRDSPYKRQNGDGAWMPEPGLKF